MSPRTAQLATTSKGLRIGMGYTAPRQAMDSDAIVIQSALLKRDNSDRVEAALTIVYAVALVAVIAAICFQGAPV